MKIFPLSDSILLSLSPTIAGAITDYLHSIAQLFYVHSPQDCDNVNTELQHDLAWHWYCQRSIRQVPTLQYQYVSTIVQRLAARSLLTPLEICQRIQLSLAAPAANLGEGLELDCWYNNAGYIYFELTPTAISMWLEYIHDLPILPGSDSLRSGFPTMEASQRRIDREVPSRLCASRQDRGYANESIDLPTKQAVTVDIALYAHARCRSLLQLARTENQIEITDNWQLNMSKWSIGHIDENRPTTALTSIFEHPAEQRLIQVLMAVLDGIHSHRRQLDSPHQLKSRNTSADRNSIAQRIDNSSEKVKSPNWAKLTIDLAQSWLDFYRYCRIFGDIKSQNPRLAIARCGLTAIAHRYLQVLLENYLGVSTLDEL